MSSSGSDNPELKLGDGSGTSVLSGIVNFLQAGGSVTRVLMASGLGVVVAPFVAVADIISGVGTFFTTPFSQGAVATGELITAFFTAPGSLLQTGAQVSEDFLTGILGPTAASALGLPVATGITLLSLFLVTQFLEEPETSDTLPLPGFPDVPDIGPFEFGSDEEPEFEDEDNIG